MVEINSNIHTVKSGECAWNVAQKNLRSNGKQVTNGDILKEMKRLAALNGCDTVEDFNTKFFSKVGSKFLLSTDSKKCPPSENTSKNISVPDTISSDTIARQDNTKFVHQPDSTKVVKQRPVKQVQSVEEREINSINSMSNDTDKIIEYNKKHPKGNYIIVDKKSCSATVYDQNGKKLKSYEVLLGQTKGDRLSRAFAKDASRRTYTSVPGEFTFSGNKGTHGGMLYLGESACCEDPDIEIRPDRPGSGGKIKLGARMYALHGTANPKVRNKFYNNGTLADNRQSMGCINIPVDALNEIKTKYGIGIGSSCYILPEEKGNKLVLQKQKDGTVKFVTHYKDESQNDKLARVNDSIAEKNIQKKKAQQPKVIAQKESENEFCWYNPLSWFS